MVLNYGLLVLFVALVYGVVTQLFPDFPVSEEVLLAFLIWALARLGVEVTAPAVRGFLVRRGFLQADEYEYYE